MKKTQQLTKKLVKAIVTEKRPYSQDSGRKQADEYTSQDEDTHFNSAIVDCIRDRQLTTALDFLEKRGLTGDTALFVVASIQKLGGAS